MSEEEKRNGKKRTEIPALKKAGIFYAACAFEKSNGNMAGFKMKRYVWMRSGISGPPAQEIQNSMARREEERENREQNQYRQASTKEQSFYV